MARKCRLLYPEDDAVQRVAEMVGKMKPRRRRAVNPQKVRAELEEMLLARDFASLRPLHFVSLWARCHESAYGAAPVELAGDVWLAAASAAAKLQRDEFGDDPAAMVEFLRWVWSREKFREKKARHDGDDRVSRIGWRLLFAQRYLLTDYRIHLSRRAAP